MVACSIVSNREDWSTYAVQSDFCYASQSTQHQTSSALTIVLTMQVSDQEPVQINKSSTYKNPAIKFHITATDQRLIPIRECGRKALGEEGTRFNRMLKAQVA